MKAAEKLGCSVFELLSRPDCDFWVAAALAAYSIENRIQEDVSR